MTESFTTPLRMPDAFWRFSRDAAARDRSFIERVMALWEQGLNTQEIARKVDEHQSAVEAALAAGRQGRTQI